MLPNSVLHRRTLLRGLGTAIALPMLEAMTPRLAVAGLSPNQPRPLRMGFVYVPNGMNMHHWTPQEEGPLGELPSILQPLGEFKNDLLVLSGLTCDKARPHGDGGGDHARAMSAFLTGSQPKKTAGADIRAGVSVDQLAARHVGNATRFPSLEIGCDPSMQSGNCDTGYSCAYSSTISWRTATTPLPKETSPRQLFDRLFGAGGKEQAAARAKREAYNKSILDLARDDAAKLHDELGRADRQKLDEYLTAVREIELRIAKSGEAFEPPTVAFVKPVKDPRGAAEYPNHIALLNDLLVLAWQTDQTRIATFVFANEGSTRSYPFAGVPDGHHDISHHQNNADKLEKIRKINCFHTAQFASLLAKLRDTPDGDGSLLDHSMIVYGSGNSDGNRHNHDELPILLAGRANGTYSPGRHLRFPKETPLTNLFVEMLDRMGVRVASFGDSTGRIAGLKT